MYIAEVVSGKDRQYRCVLLRESYRQGGTVKNRTIANLTGAPAKTIEAIKLALRHQDDLGGLGALSEAFELREGPSIGAVWCVLQIARRLGIEKALGTDRPGKLALWQIMARVIDQGSRLSAVRLAGVHAACDLLGIDKPFNEDHLYANLAWLEAGQDRIEGRLLRARRGPNKPELFLYDVTSSYLEGDCNALADWGVNRDGKKRKKQIVIGLLCDEGGEPVSIQVFRGNTSDLRTLADQVQKVARRFGCRRVTFVGDRGMIKSAQVEDLHEEFFYYITAITKPQIEKLLKAGVLQMQLFDQNICEVFHDGIRYVLRRNPQRTLDVGRNRLQRKAALEHFVQQINRYLKEHPKATVEVGLRKVHEKIRRLKLGGFVAVATEGRLFKLIEDPEKLAQQSRLDGCYVIKSDLPKEVCEAETIHERYKDLAMVEQAFRTCKTGHLEMRPIHVRCVTSTRGHAVVVMLAYMVVRELAGCWAKLDLTVEEGLTQLSTLCTQQMLSKSGGSCHCIPTPREPSRRLLRAAGVELPRLLPDRGVRVVTRKKLPPRRTRS
jgi:hypothetical protein